MNILLLDDEYLALNLLETYIRRLVEEGRDIRLVDKVKHPLKALEILEQEHIDILFLDIQMPNLSGIAFLKNIHIDPVTVFTTAYSEHAIEAFDLNVVDYLVKPIAFERFVQALHKATNAVLAKQKKIEPVSSAPTSLSTSAASGFISVVADGKFIKIALADILFCEAAKEYVILHTLQGNIMTLERMKRMEELLPTPEFVRVHRSYIVASDKVKSLEGSMLNVAGQMIPVSRELREQIIAKIFRA
ncbi:MAG: LytTR family DNA-binding domain-containing protein [Candidatus Kapabacteria bacterium]|jgi:DNA-binding LytR/AlgR family response regulator|nr:LytTR family DNA-binding domain-containing protein [Candidatus Kapabacteria bacterium]